MSHVRFFHGSTEGPPVDIYFNDHMMASHLDHGNFTEYEEIEPGDYAVSVYYTGTYVQPVYTTTVSIPRGVIYTYTLAGLYPRIIMAPLLDSCELSAAVSPMVRFVQLSYDLPDVDCYYDDGTLLWSGCSYGTATTYTYISPGVHTVYLYPTGTTAPCLTVPNVFLAPGSYYTFYTYGSPASTVHPLKMHIPLDGHSYIQQR